MKRSFNAWPEIIFISGTYRLLKLGYILLLNAVVDGLGQTELVSACIVRQETKDIIRWFIENVKKHHEDACTHVKCVMGDKEMVGRGIIKEMLGVPIYICSFHVMKAMKNAMTTEKMKISAEEKNISLDLM